VCFCCITDQFEQERDELLAAVERCAVNRDDVHRLEWENRKRADEIKELQKVSWAQHVLMQRCSLGHMQTTAFAGCKSLLVLEPPVKWSF
jgi:hypothetical protein